MSNVWQQPEQWARDSPVQEAPQAPCTIFISNVLSTSGEAMEQRWVKSSFSDRFNCLEVWRHEDIIMIRESDQPHIVVATSPANWGKFLLAAKAGEFDLL